MARERTITPAAYLAGETVNAVLTIRFTNSAGKRDVIRVKGIGSYRLRTDGSRFSVRGADKAGSQNKAVITYRENGSVVIAGKAGRVIAKDVTISLNEGAYTVVCA